MAKGTWVPHCCVLSDWALCQLQTLSFRTAQSAGANLLLHRYFFPGKYFFSTEATTT